MRLQIASLQSTMASQENFVERDCNDLEEMPITEEQFVLDGMNALHQRLAQLRIVRIFFSVIIGRDFSLLCGRNSTSDLPSTRVVLSHNELVADIKLLLRFQITQHQTPKNSIQHRNACGGLRIVH
ncbi:hypothetical protein Y032_0229g2897 [Ancylostoma ceylanicum]|nr:hypothetical protein Y032_0229g2897 [Ancylostoma ceylanicum]